MYKFDEINQVHLELTDRCNAACSMCPRNIRGGIENPQLPNTELSLSQIKQIFYPLFLTQLKRILVCGNYGDPTLASDTLDIFRYFLSINPNLEIIMHTNGGARNAKWWKTLASILNNKSRVVFNIDGLEDTNHIYRKNTVWSRIINNAKSFISAGGLADWNFLVFQHNEHQVELARTLSDTIGFKTFQIKKSFRFIVPGVGKKINQFISSSGNIIQPPTNTSYQHVLLKIDNTSVYDKHTLKTTEIQCKVKKEKSIYISAEGIVQPCCWMANQMYTWHNKDPQVWKNINAVGKDNISALHRDIRGIIEDIYFKKIIPENWDNSKLDICSITCGVNISGVDKQFI